MKTLKLNFPCVAFLKKSKQSMLYAFRINEIWELYDKVPDMKIIGFGSKRYENDTFILKISVISAFDDSETSEDWFKLKSNTLSWDNFVIVSMPKSYQIKTFDANRIEDDDRTNLLFDRIVLKNGSIYKLPYHMRLSAEADMKILEF